ncbi:MAG TPA: hypothetical protein VF337_10940 [Candidatus Limnocylindrales bacterium]
MNSSNPDQAPGTPTSRGGVRKLATIALIFVLLGAAGLLIYSTATSLSGTVIFSTDQPISGVHSGCTIDHQVVSVSASSPVYATYMFSPVPTGDVISLEISKNGRTFVAATPIPAEYTEGIACFSDTSDLSKSAGWGPGSYHFSAINGDTVVAAGDLIVT